MIKDNNILNINFNFIDYESVLAQICEWKKLSRNEFVTITNPHSVLLCHHDEKMMQAARKAALALPDGTGIIWSANILGYKHKGRITGPNLMLKICDWGRKEGLRHFFYGGTEDVTKKLVDNLNKQFPGLDVAGTYCPPFTQCITAEDEAIIDLINTAKPDIVWVGLGAPKQEKWMAEHLGKIDATAMIGIGAAFDFHSGNITWAPKIVRKLGIEWIWRLVQNPKRMWRRNIDSPVFLIKVIGQKIKLITDF